MGAELQKACFDPTFRTLTSRAEVFLEHGRGPYNRSPLPAEASSSATLPASSVLLLWAPSHGWGIGYCAALAGTTKSAGGT